MTTHIVDKAYKKATVKLRLRKREYCLLEDIGMEVSLRLTVAGGLNCRAEAVKWPPRAALPTSSGYSLPNCA